MVEEVRSGRIEREDRFAPGAGYRGTGKLPVLRGRGLVVVAARTMHMPVLDFFGGGLSYFFYGYVELEGHAGQGVVGVYGYVLIVYFDDPDDAGALGGAGFELHAGFDVVDAVEIGAGDGLDEVGVVVAVAFVGGDGDSEGFAWGFAFELGFEAWDDVGSAMEVSEGLAAFGGVDDFSLGVGEGVVDGGYGVFGDLHGVMLSG